MKGAEIREAFPRFFEGKGRTRVASSSLIPTNGPTLLFANAGTNQFKGCFLGLEERAYTRVTTSQKCVYAGGKHNDLENVGYTARRHTFFETLGNFNFGGYFKRSAIHYARELLTGEEWLNLPKEKPWVTVYATNDEAYGIWIKGAGVPAERMARTSDNKGVSYVSDNFWAVGDTGPHGPCTEIFFDHGPEIWSGPPGSPEEDGDRYIEIWNNVFMQFNRIADGVMYPLPASSVNTDMGLERASVVLQHVYLNYGIDPFQNLLKASTEVIGCANNDASSLKVVADHIRSYSLLTVDDVLPSNEGRGYVLRRIIRRACRHGSKLDARGTFFHKIAATLVIEVGDAFSELKQQQAHIEHVLKIEEKRFAKTLEQGPKIPEQDFAKLQGSVIPGNVVFKLYDTYGSPVDLTNDIARERELTIDKDGFEREMEAQREHARVSSTSSMDYNSLIKVDGETRFLGYQGVSGTGQIVALFRDGQAVECLEEGEEGVVILDQMPFYAESGGQVSDNGHFEAAGVRLDVHDIAKAGSAYLHHGVVARGNLNVGGVVKVEVDASVRQATAFNHSVTRPLYAALCQVLGDHVQQKGLLVDSQRPRLDSNHSEVIKAEQPKTLEDIINAEIRHNTEVGTEETDIDIAKAKGVMALFGEKYGDQMCVPSTGGDFSVGLCDGTHTSRIGDTGPFKITSEGGMAAGVCRVEAVTGAAALAYPNGTEGQLEETASLVKDSRDNLLDKLGASLECNRSLEKELEQPKAKVANMAGDDLSAAAAEIKGAKVLAARLDGLDGRALLALVDQLKDKLGRAVILLDGELDGEVVLAAGVTQDLTGQLKAGGLMKQATVAVGDEGGGRSDTAQGGGTDTAKLDEALTLVQHLVEQGL